MSVEKIIITEICSAGSKELVAYETIMPGDLVEKNKYNKLQKHKKQFGSARKTFATEDWKKGKMIEDPYEKDTIVQYKVLRDGEVAKAWLAAGNFVVVGTPCCSNGDGTLCAATESTPAGSVICTSAQELTALVNTRFVIDV